MANEIPKHTADEVTPALRKALVESGAIIPTSPEEVTLAENHLTRTVTPQEIAEAFSKLEAALDETSPPSPFMQLDECVVPPTGDGLAMAARNGVELDADTLAIIEDVVAHAKRKPPQT